jgi:hypothetical protein
MSQIDPPVIPNGQEIYNLLMKDIESDLLPENLDILEGKYKGETAEEKRARKNRYNAAFEKYDKELDKYLKDLDQKILQYKKTAIKSLEEKNRSTEDSDLSAIENEINNAT